MLAGDFDESLTLFERAVRWQQQRAHLSFARPASLPSNSRVHGASGFSQIASGAADRTRTPAAAPPSTGRHSRTYALASPAPPPRRTSGAARSQRVTPVIVQPSTRDRAPSSSSAAAQAICTPSSASQRPITLAHETAAHAHMRSQATIGPEPPSPPPSPPHLPHAHADGEPLMGKTRAMPRGGIVVPSSHAAGQASLQTDPGVEDAWDRLGSSSGRFSRQSSRRSTPTKSCNHAPAVLHNWEPPGAACTVGTQPALGSRADTCSASASPREAPSVQQGAAVPRVSEGHGQGEDGSTKPSRAEAERARARERDLARVLRRGGEEESQLPPTGSSEMSHAAGR
jgi:hypothetical protein